MPRGRAGGATPRRTWVRAGGIERFLRETIPALAAEPAANTQLLTVFDRLRREGAHVFGERDPELLTWYGAEGAIEAALLRTPPYAYILAGRPDPACIAALVDLLLDPAAGLDGREINVPEDCLAALVEAWTARTGETPRETERNRLYRLAEPLDPDPLPAGRPKLADPSDVPVVAHYLVAFWEEVEHSAPRDLAMTAQRIAAARIAEGDFLLWLDTDDAPVSAAGFTPIVAGAGRVGPVFTPRELRGRGYAGAVTAAAGRVLRARGAAEVLLFTDLANPTSNALYQRIGYRAVSDRVRLQLAG
jgi:GNAT superfamily N-acetyltransferase